MFLNQLNQYWGLGKGRTSVGRVEFGRSLRREVTWALRISAKVTSGLKEMRVRSCALEHAEQRFKAKFGVLCGLGGSGRGLEGGLRLDGVLDLGEPLLQAGLGGSLRGAGLRAGRRGRSNLQKIDTIQIKLIA